MCTGIKTTERSLKSKYHEIFLTLKESHPKKIDSVMYFMYNIIFSSLSTS